MKSGVTNTLWAKVMAGQPVGQWAILKRCPQQAKNG